MMLGPVILGWRTANRYGVRAAAKAIGISYTTLNRIENNHGCDSRTFAKIMLWLLADSGKEKG